MLKKGSLLAVTVMMLTVAAPVFAADTSKVYTSGLLVLLFVGFCALLVVMQLVPAILSVLGLTKKAARGAAMASAQSVTVKKN